MYKFFYHLLIITGPLTTCSFLNIWLILENMIFLVLFGGWGDFRMIFFRSPEDAPIYEIRKA
jgi:hypothetical protein